MKKKLFLLIGTILIFILNSGFTVDQNELKTFGSLPLQKTHGPDGITRKEMTDYLDYLPMYLTPIGNGINMTENSEHKYDLIEKIKINDLESFTYNFGYKYMIFNTKTGDLISPDEIIMFDPDKTTILDLTEDGEIDLEFKTVQRRHHPVPEGVYGVVLSIWDKNSKETQYDTMGIELNILRIKSTAKAYDEKGNHGGDSSTLDKKRIIINPEKLTVESNKDEETEENKHLIFKNTKNEWKVYKANDSNQSAIAVGNGQKALDDFVASEKFEKLSSGKYILHNKATTYSEYNNPIDHIDMAPFAIQKKVKVHLRQKVEGSHGELVKPSQGYFEIINNNEPTKLDPVKKFNEMAEEQQTVKFTNNLISPATGAKYLHVTNYIPEYYKLKSTVVTYDETKVGVEHQVANKPPIPVVDVDIEENPETWITFFIEPRLDISKNERPRPFSWDYKLNKFGKLTK